MNKKVLVLSSSPRKSGNSDTLCDEFLKGANEAGNIAEKIFINDKNINYCTGCYSCKGNGNCVQNDDMAEILRKIIEADVIVMATPVYFYTMCGQMKTLIDRLVAKYTSIRNKEMYFIATAAVSSKPALERTIEEFRGLLACLNGAKEKGIIYATGVWDVEDVKNTKFMTQSYELGKTV